MSARLVYYSDARYLLQSKEKIFKEPMSFLLDLDPAQREAVQAVKGPIMIVAGAGSGKTRVLTYRIAHLIDFGIPAYRILALTFTNKAATEMKSRIVKLVGENSAQIWMGTFHSMFARILRREAEHLGFHRNFTIYDTDDSLSLVRHAQQFLRISFHQFNPAAMRARISSAKNRCISPAEFANRGSDIVDEKTARVYAEYQKRLKESNALDFDDLLLKPIELFQKNKKILETYQDRFPYILVDEYQDTNRAQYVLLKLLAQKYRNICVVGDDAQSIYAFRGADIRNILDFKEEFPDCKTFRLEQNYRSTKTILAAADRVIKNNVDQIHKDLWTRNSDGERISLMVCNDDREEGQLIVNHLQKEIAGKKLDLNDSAVLYRTNAQSRSLEDAFRRNGIPYVIVGGIEFYKRKEIKDLLAYLRLVVNLQDDESFVRIINVPLRGIGETTIKRLQAHAAKQRSCLWAGLLGICGEEPIRRSGIPPLSSRVVQSLRKFHGMISKYVRLKQEMSPSELSRALVDELGILHDLKEEGTPEALARWENVQELLSAISQYSEDNPQATLENFLEEVALITDIDKWDENRNAVTLMTSHSAKGLEFEIVFIAGLEEGLFPFYRSVLDQKELEEERRLYYVAITRAKTKLYLSWARVRYRFGSKTYTSPSRFLGEIDQALFQLEGDTRSRSSSRSLVTIEAPAEERQDIQPPVVHNRARVVSDREIFADDGYFFDDRPACENESQDVPEILVGTRVEHDVFGRGRVIGVSGRGEFAKAIVDFQGAGRKHLLLKYAHLRIVSPHGPR